MSGRYALNIADLTRSGPLVTQTLLSGVIENREVVNCEEGRLDGGAVVLDCVPERARSLIEFLWRMDSREERYLTRAYSEGPNGGWSKVKHGAVKRGA